MADAPAARRPCPGHAYWTGWLGLALVAVMALCALFSPQLAPHDPYAQDISARLRPPAWASKGSAEHPLGTDHVGRDYLSRIIYGARVSLAVGLLAVARWGGLGVTAGLVMGFRGRLAERALTFLSELTLTRPFTPLAIAVIALMGAAVVNMVLLLGVTSWPIYARVVRAEVLSLREREFVLAGVGLGSSPARILLGHILPNLSNLL